MYIRTFEVCQTYKLGMKHQIKRARDNILVDCVVPSLEHKTQKYSDDLVEFKIYICSRFGSRTSWEILANITSASSKEASLAVEKNWFHSKPRPSSCGHDNGPRFMGQEL